LIGLLETKGIEQFAQGSAQTHSAHKIPEVSEHFLGRDDDLERVLEQVRRHRVVTLTGMGGIGKSEMAKSVARAAEREGWTADGVLYVDLQATTDTATVKSTLVASLALKPERAIADQLTGRRLYVLDDLYQALVEDRQGIQAFVRGLYDADSATHFL